MQKWEYLRFEHDSYEKVTKVHKKGYEELVEKSKDEVIDLLGDKSWKLVTEVDTYFRLMRPKQKPKGG